PAGLHPRLRPSEPPTPADRRHEFSGRWLQHHNFVSGLLREVAVGGDVYRGHCTRRNNARHITRKLYGVGGLERRGGVFGEQHAWIEREGASEAEALQIERPELGRPALEHGRQADLCAERSYLRRQRL